tara:strand:- start:1484 stop:1678 length:195 start_codon:yes stop_codon:yes gene_type:complete
MGMIQKDMKNQMCYFFIGSKATIEMNPEFVNNISNISSVVEAVCVGLTLMCPSSKSSFRLRRGT